MRMFLRSMIELKIMKDNHDLHPKCDVLLLADVFEKFRNSSSKSYLSHYLRTLGLRWDAVRNA